MTYREIDLMTLPDIWELFRYWESYPPYVEMRYSVWKVKRPERTQQAPDQSRATPEDAAALRALSRGKVKTFDQLPLALQQMMREQRG